MIIHTKVEKNDKLVNLALVGSGAFATAVHLPNINSLKNKFSLHAVMNRTGKSTKYVSETYGASYATTNYDDILNDQSIDAVLISTPHKSHAELS